jgi:hypothetical protein
VIIIGAGGNGVGLTVATAAADKEPREAVVGRDGSGVFAGLAVTDVAAVGLTEVVNTVTTGVGVIVSIGMLVGTTAIGNAVEDNGGGEGRLVMLGIKVGVEVLVMDGGADTDTGKVRGD